MSEPIYDNLPKKDLLRQLGFDKEVTPYFDEWECRDDEEPYGEVPQLFPAEPERSYNSARRVVAIEAAYKRTLIETRIDLHGLLSLRDNEAAQDVFSHCVHHIQENQQKRDQSDVAALQNQRKSASSPDGSFRCNPLMRS